jgi:hypothetical protein
MLVSYFKPKDGDDIFLQNTRLHGVIPQNKELFLITHLFDFNLESQYEITSKLNFFIYIHTKYVFDLLTKEGRELPIDIM